MHAAPVAPGMVSIYLLYRVQVCIMANTTVGSTTAVGIGLLCEVVPCPVCFVLR